MPCRHGPNIGRERRVRRGRARAQIDSYPDCAAAPVCPRRHAMSSNPKVDDEGVIINKNIEGVRTLPGRLTNVGRSEEHTSELQSLMRISYAVFCLKTKKNQNKY